MEIADKIVINRKSGVVEIDGKPLGVALAMESIQATFEPEGMSIVRLPILCSRVELIDDEG